MAGSGQSMPWSDAEDRLLCAIVHEFGSNWFLVADVLSASCAMQGIYRSPTTCRYRFRNLTVRPPFSAIAGSTCPSCIPTLSSNQLHSSAAHAHQARIAVPLFSSVVLQFQQHPAGSP